MSQAIYDKNVKLLEGYKYYYGPNLKEFLYNEEYHSSEDINHITVQQNEKIILCNETSLNKINQYENESYKEVFLKWKRIPLYLYYDIDVFKAVLQEMDLNSLNFNERIVIIVGMDSFERYFENMQTILPILFIGSKKEIIENRIREIKQNRERILNNAREEIKEYYANNSENILENIRNKNYKILFIETRFTGYRCLRDLYDGCLEAGYDVLLAIEDSNINRIYYELYIAKCKPDIIFAANIFRFEMNYIPKQVIFTTWILDAYKNIINKETPSKLIYRDVLCNALPNYYKLWECGYDKENMIELLFPANNKVYKKHNISPKEYEDYGCDIVLVSNNTNFNKHLKSALNNINEKFRTCIYEMSKAYYELEYNEKSIYGIESLREYIRMWLIKYNLNFTDIEFDNICDEFYMIRYYARKNVLARWLLEANKYNIKLWGLDWDDMPAFKKYSMGVAMYGEMLSKIYQCSKIAISSNPNATFAIRIAEITLSNSLALVDYMPKEQDVVPCSTFMQFDKDIVCYYNKKDLYEKLDYYLENQDERLNMIKRTKKILLDKLSVKKQAVKAFTNIEKQVSDLHY